jgi:hypothetical protein
MVSPHNRLLAEVRKRGRGNGERFVIFPFPFNLFPPLAKRTFARGLINSLIFFIYQGINH